MAETSTSIGRFEVLGKISRGGMADIYRCRLRGIGGFEKIVALKRIRAERASDPEFVTMFLDEARLAAGLSHPNIIQVFEIGEVDGAPYIAMEYVKGPTLAQLLREAQRAGTLPLGPVVKVLSDVAAGLHHAHTAAGPGGEPLGLVHRDVSPQNILVSREGIPKLLDFGVAKARGRLTETQDGTLKGKLRYMAPEQLAGAADHRADVFALGVCLFEATTGQSPHGPASVDEAALVKNILDGKYLRPSDLCPDYPRMLEEVVVWALERDVERRCPSAWELHECLEEVITRGPLTASTRAVRDWVSALFPGDELAPPPAESSGKATRPERGAETALAEVTMLPPPPRPRRRRGVAVAVAAAATLAAVLLAGGFAARRRQTEAIVPPAAELEELPSMERAPAAVLAAPAPLPAAPLDLAGLERRPPRRTAARRRAPAAHPPTAPRPALAAATEAPPPLAVLPGGPAAPPPAAAGRSGVYSPPPRADVPVPQLPRVTTARGPADLDRVLASVEQESTRAGCSPEFARGITAALRRATQPPAELYPEAMYYFIVRAAGLGWEKTHAADELARAHASGVIRALSHVRVQPARRF